MYSVLKPYLDGYVFGLDGDVIGIHRYIARSWTRSWKCRNSPSGPQRNAAVSTDLQFWVIEVEVVVHGGDGE
jgi:hypothetical protein